MSNGIYYAIVMPVTKYLSPEISYYNIYIMNKGHDIFHRPCTKVQS